MSYTTADLIARIKRWAAIPADQPAFSNTELISMINEEMDSIIVPLIMSMREEYFVTYADYTITSNTSTYSIPTGAIGQNVREVKLVDTNGNYINLPRINQTDLGVAAYGFYLQGNDIVLLYPEDYVNYTLRVWYYLRPNVLIETTNTALGVKAIATVGSTSLTVVSVPTVWVSGTTRVDIIGNNSPFKLLGSNLLITFTGTTITVTIPTGTAIGDWIVATGYSPITQIPIEAQNLLSQGVVLKVLESLGDVKGIQLAIQKYKQMEESLKDLLSPRVVGESKRIQVTDSFL